MTHSATPQSQDMRIWLFLGAVNGFLAVIAGAVGAHVLENRLQGPARGFYDMAAHFQLWHALALVAVALLSTYPRRPAGARWLRVAGTGFIAGIVLFCGPLYDLAIAGSSAVHWIIPIGGMCLIGGWLALAIAALYMGPQPGGDA